MYRKSDEQIHEFIEVTQIIFLAIFLCFSAVVTSVGFDLGTVTNTICVLSSLNA